MEKLKPTNQVTTCRFCTAHKKKCATVILEPGTIMCTCPLCLSAGKELKLFKKNPQTKKYELDRYTLNANPQYFYSSGISLYSWRSLKSWIRSIRIWFWYRILILYPILMFVFSTTTPNEPFWHKLHLLWIVGAIPFIIGSVFFYYRSQRHKHKAEFCDKLYKMLYKEPLNILFYKRSLYTYKKYRFVRRHDTGVAIEGLDYSRHWTTLLSSFYAGLLVISLGVSIYGHYKRGEVVVKKETTEGEPVSNPKMPASQNSKAPKANKKSEPKAVKYEDIPVVDRSGEKTISLDELEAGKQP